MQSSPSVARSAGSSQSPESRGHRVLLLADRDLTATLKDWLKRLGFDVYDAREAVANSPVADGCDWLSTQLFPPTNMISENPKSEDRLPRRFFRKTARLLAVSGRETASKEKQDRDESATLFRWNEFDIVIIQDLWLTPDENAGPIPLGCVLAFDDYYLMANFLGRKIILITDPGFFKKKTPDIPLAAALTSMFDQNRQIVYLPLVGDSEVELPLQRLKRVLNLELGAEASDFNLSGGAKETLIEYRDSLLDRAFSILIERIKEYISERADVVLVDDDPKTTKSLFECLSCGKFLLPERTEAGQVSVLSLGPQAQSVSFRNFSELVEHCKQVQKDTTTARKNVLFVTDILFDRVQWTGDDQRRTGIELIEDLRKVQEWRQSVGIVAFTSLSTPFVTTQAYQLGADAVVFKPADPLAIGHSHLSPSRAGMDRLLLMLAFLCFQKQFLREKRMARHDNANQELEHLKQVLPRYAVSPHVQEEWNDTFYILKGLHTYPVLPEEFKSIREELVKKYDRPE